MLQHIIKQNMISSVWVTSKLMLLAPGHSEDMHVLRTKNCSLFFWGNFSNGMFHVSTRWTSTTYHRCSILNFGESLCVSTNLSLLMALTMSATQKHYIYLIMFLHESMCQSIMCIPSEEGYTKSWVLVIGCILNHVLTVHPPISQNKVGIRLY